MLSDTQKEEMELEDKRIKENLSKIKFKIMVLSGKGGVGKTTISVNLASCLQQHKYRTGILDADITGPNVAKIFNIGSVIETDGRKIIPFLQNGIKVVSLGGMINADDPVIWRGPLRSKLLNQFIADTEWGELDVFIIDLPPGTGDEIITIGQKIKPDMAIIVTIPHELALADSNRAINMAKKMDIPKIALIENMAGFKCPNCESVVDIFGFGGGESQALESGIDFLGRLPVCLEFNYGVDWQKPFVKSDIQNEILSIVSKIEGYMPPNISKGKNIHILHSENN